MNKKQRALIIQPGAVGDVILTLPLVQFILAERAIDQVDMLGHLDRLSYLQPRTLLGDTLSLESVGLHRLFVNSDTFELNEADDLVELFGPYELILSFLSDETGHFEKNLVSATSRTSACDVVTLELRPAAESRCHVSTFFIQQFVRQMPDMDLDSRRSYLEAPRIESTGTCRDKGKNLLQKNGIDPDASFVVVHPGSGGAEKCWPLERFCHLAQRLVQRSQKLVFLTGPAEQERHSQMAVRLRNDYPVLSDCDLDQVAALLSCASGYVGNDSGITHLAAALCPTVAIFGATNPAHWRPPGAQVELLQASAGQDWPEVEQVLSYVKQSSHKGN